MTGCSGSSRFIPHLPSQKPKKSKGDEKNKKKRRF
jgi:hypothetical protein